MDYGAVFLLWLISVSYSRGQGPQGPCAESRRAAAPPKPRAEVVALSWAPVGVALGGDTRRDFPEGAAPPADGRARTHEAPGARAGVFRADQIHFIHNGYDAYPNQQPWQTTLQVYWQGQWYHVCGGTLLEGLDWVITAAHCVNLWGHQPASGNVRMRAGLGWFQLDLGPGQPGAQTFNVVKVIKHPGYNGGEIGNSTMHDLALLQLSRAATQTQHVTHAQLPTPAYSVVDNAWCSLTGWGKTETGLPNTLQKTWKSVMASPDCAAMWTVLQVQLYPKFELCTIDWTYQSTACSGDSGGPLICGKTPVLAGVVSWGLGTCTGCFPSVYTRVSEYRPWIDAVLSSDGKHPAQNTGSTGTDQKEKKKRKKKKRRKSRNKKSLKLSKKKKTVGRLSRRLLGDYGVSEDMGDSAMNGFIVQDANDYGSVVEEAVSTDDGAPEGTASEVLETMGEPSYMIEPAFMGVLDGTAAIEDVGGLAGVDAALQTYLSDADPDAIERVRQLRLQRLGRAGRLDDRLGRAARERRHARLPRLVNGAPGPARPPRRSRAYRVDDRLSREDREARDQRGARDDRVAAQPKAP